MATFKELTTDYRHICTHYVVFVSQTDVRYVIPGRCSLHFTKSDLIASINHFLIRLCLYYSDDVIKHGFVLDKFKYYELSVYFHGVLQLYCSTTNKAPVGELFINKFSHLPHDILKPVKPLKDIQVAKLEDIFGGSYYCCVISSTSLCSDTLEGLRGQITYRFPNILSKYRFRFDVAETTFLPF